MSWILVLPAIIVSAAVLLLPGLAIGVGIGLRRLWLWALAPAISVTVLALAAIALPLVGLPWAPLTIAVFALVFAALVIALFRFALRAKFTVAAPGARASWPTPVAWAVGAAVLALYFVLGIGSPANISQTFDNVFHLNAIAYIGQTANASPLDIGGLTAPNGGSGFYPAAWHAMVQLVAQLSGVSIAVAINAFNLAALVLAWPAGIILLTRQVAGRTPIVTLSAGILSAAFAAAPLHMLHYGVLYPYFLGLVLIPATVATLMQLLRVTNDRVIAPPLACGVLLLGLVPATMLAHPGTAMGALALSVPVVFIAALRTWGSLTPLARITRIAALCVFCVIGILVVWKLGIEDFWGPRQDTFSALKQTTTLALNGYGFQTLVTALVVIGAWFAFKRRNSAGIVGVAMVVVAAGLYFVALGASNYWLRVVTQLWYGDAPRLGAIVPIAVIPVAALGVRAMLGRRGAFRRGAALPAVIALVTLLVLTQLGSGMQRLVADMRGSYATTDTSALLSTDERALLERLPDEVGEGEMIAGSPWTGAALAYALADRRVVLTHMFMTNPGADRDLIMSELGDADENPEVCEALDRLNVRWVLDFGEHEVHGGDHSYPGVENLEYSDAVVEVDREGDAALYRVVACD